MDFPLIFKSALLAGLFAIGYAALAVPTASPNVVFITIDTLRPDHLGCYGDKQIGTPNIDTLAADGTRFERAYTAVPVTLPSHTVIFTGTYPTLSGVHDFAANKLSPTQATLASVLKDNGYTTGAVIGSAVLDSRFGLNHGFDFYYDHFDFNRLQESNLDEMERPGNIVADVTLDWLSKNYQKKFFLWMHVYDPHYPYRPPPPYSEQYKDRPYDGEIVFADAQVGRLIEFLKNKGLYQNTLIILSGVQGQSLLPIISPKKEDNARSLYAETFLPRLHFNWSELRGVETENYHFIDAPKPELYDLRKDPGETHNLFAEKKAVTEEMRVRLAKLIQQYTAGQELAEKTGLDPALMERLKSLGYAGFSGGSNSGANIHALPDPKDRIQTYEIFSDAMADSQHGQYAQSIEKLNTALKTDPDSVPGHYLQGLNYYRTHEFPKSVAELERVLQLSPDYALAAFQLGLAYVRVSNWDQAIQTLRRALELDSTNFAAAYDLGLSYLQKNMTGEAAAAFRQSVSIADSYAPGHRALGELLLSQGQLDEALSELHKAAELAPEDASTHSALARALAAKGLASEAQDEMRKAEQAPPQ